MFCLAGLPIAAILDFNVNISVVSRAKGLKFRILAYHPKIYNSELFWHQTEKVCSGRFSYGSHPRFSNVNIWVVWRALGHKLRFFVIYTQIDLWDPFWNNISHLWFIQKTIFQLFEELLRWNSKLKLIMGLILILKWVCFI